MNNHMVRLLTYVLMSLTCSSIVLGQDNPAGPDDPAALLPELSRPKVLNVQTPDTLEGEGELRWSWDYEHPSTTLFLRLRIRLDRLSANKSWSLRIIDENNNIVQTLTEESFIGQPPTGRWTQRIDGRKVRVELRSSSKPIDLKVVIDRLNFSYFTPGQRVLTTGSDDMRDIKQVDAKYYGYGRPTAIIFLQRATNQNETNCTGFLLTSSLMITNRHCISEDWQLQTATAEFGYESDSLTKEIRSFSKLEVQNSALDFTILRFSTPVTSWSTVTFGLEPVRKDQPLVLIQYPSARYKTISIRDCKVMSETVLDRPNRPNDFYHLCDTEGGSSGSALMDESTGRVVGLHYYGIYRANKMGRNLAIKFTAILECLRSDNKTLSLYNEIMGQQTNH